VRIIRIIRLGENSRILTNLIMDMNVGDNYALAYSFLPIFKHVFRVFT